MAYDICRLDPGRREIRVLSLTDYNGPSNARSLDCPEVSQDGNLDGSDIRCRINPLRLDGTTPYYALSYVWGAQEPKAPITLNGHQIEVVPNLRNALKHLRERPELSGKNLWIDAICINQEDLQEKALQVDMMGDIYRNAEKVFIWLGEEDNDSNLAMELLSSVSQNKLQELFDDTQTKSQAWEAVRKLFERLYWRRVWVLQEVLLSRSAYVLCGDAICSWESVMMLLRRSNFVQEVVVRSSPQRRAVLDSKLLPVLLVDTIERRRRGKTGLLDYLVLSRQRRATVAHDHIYGIMGLVNERILKADYTKPVREVYREVAVHILKSERSLGILSICCETQSNQHELPSWVPDWRLQFKEDYQSFLLSQLNYSAGMVTPETKPEIDLDHDDWILKVSGIFIDTVDFTSSTRDLGRWPQVSEDWQCWTKNAANITKQYGGFEEQREAFRKALYCQYNGETRKYDGSEQFFDIAVSSSAPHPSPAQLSHPTRSYGNAGRQLFGTRTGYMGRGLYSVRAGDIVVLLLGARVPFVLRESKTLGEYYLVGECYLHGVMDGEMARARTRRQWEWFNLI
ncbi:heterokaryon incompatibility protein-domain-containing protein [Xylariales sp. AK1849]|nr:heterokaryon incompatibility protein-domain-containing protein [Xylariales sp. AK1849]